MSLIVENGTGRVVIELDPETVELGVVDQGHHGLIDEGTLRSTSDDIGSAGVLDQGSQRLDHGFVAFKASCGSGQHKGSEHVTCKSHFTDRQLQYRSHTHRQPHGHHRDRKGEVYPPRMDHMGQKHPI